MKQVGKFKLYSLEEVLDDVIGPKGTPERAAFEKRVRKAVRRADKKKKRG